MYSLKIILCLTVVLHHQWVHAQSTYLESQPTDSRKVQEGYGNDDNSVSTSSALLGALYRTGRQVRCVRCYDDRTDRYNSGYTSRSSDDRSNWYYPSYDRYDDRYRSDTDRNYYRDRDDRYSSRTYDRYDTRGYDRYDDRRDYGESRGYGYDTKDRYGGDRYDRYRSGNTGYGYDRDYYDRYYSRYDYRNYRPWDQTYRGQSGFDNSGRGYYFAGDSASDRRYYPQNRDTSPPCGVRVPNCRYGSYSSGDRGDRGVGIGSQPTRVSSGTISSSSQSDRNGHTNYNYNSNTYTNNDPSQQTNNNNDTNRSNGWSYINENNKNSNDNKNSGISRNRESDQQSSAYGSRPGRPLSGSYLFERDSNVVPDAGDEASKVNSDDSKNQKPDMKIVSNNQDHKESSGPSKTSSK